MRVLFVSAGDETRASTRYRVLNFLPYLSEAGIDYECLFPTKIADRVPGPDLIGYAISVSILTLRSPWYDVIFLQKIPLPALYIRILSLFTNKIVFDFDDALYTSAAWDDHDGKWARLLDSSLKRSDLVVTGSPVLSEYAHQFNQNVISLPTALPAEEYQNKSVTDDQSEEVTIGWIGNPQNLHYLASVEEPLSNVLDSYENVNLLIITAGERPVTPFADRRGNDVEYREWSLETEINSLAEADIGIRPLFDDEWTRGKGGFTSVVQKMALGIPVVVTPVGMLSDFVEHGISGFHASDNDEWIDYLKELIENPERRQTMGENAVDRVGQEGFWTHDRAPQFVRALDSLKNSK